MNVGKQSLAMCVALLLSSNMASAADKPPTMEEMWKIIEAQQVQLDAMKKSLEASQASTVAVDSEEGHAQSLTNAELKELEHKTDALTEVVETMRTALVIPEEKELKSSYGLGPAASKVYQVDQGLSIGGYGEVNFQTFVDDKGPDDKNNADMERLVLYVGYKFTDSIIFNSEIEFEHSSTAKGGSVSVELATLDFLLDPMLNVRAGMVLLPMGFINQIHEPPFFFGNNRPEVERAIIPSTWREIGVGLFGEIVPDLSYTMYAVSGLKGSNFSSDGIRGGRQKGSKAINEDMAFVGRLDYAPAALPGVTFGTSAYLGNSGQDEFDVDVFTQLYEAHIEWKYRGLEFRTLGSWGHVSNADVLSAEKGETIGSSNYGVYTEIGYDVLPLIFPGTTQYLAPFFRYEKLDTIATTADGYMDDLSKEQDIFQVGFNYKPIPQVVIKADYRNRQTKAGTKPDEFNIGFGFIF